MFDDLTEVQRRAILLVMKKVIAGAARIMLPNDAAGVLGSVGTERVADEGIRHRLTDGLYARRKVYIERRILGAYLFSCTSAKTSRALLLYSNTEGADAGTGAKPSGGDGEGQLPEVRKSKSSEARFY